MRKAAADTLHRLRKLFRGEEQMKMVRHNNKGVELVEVLPPVVLKRVEEQPRIRFDLEEARRLP